VHEPFCAWLSAKSQSLGTLRDKSNTSTSRSLLRGHLPARDLLLELLVVLALLLVVLEDLEMQNENVSVIGQDNIEPARTR
jgi:hypothetical protein